MNKKIAIGLLMLFIAFIAAAQQTAKQINYQHQLWLGYNNSIEFTKQWFLITEIETRQFVDPENAFQNLIRTHAHYRLNNQWDAGFGLAYFMQDASDAYNHNYIEVPEIRPHVEVNNKQQFVRVGFSQRWKVEWRNIHKTVNGDLSDGYTQSFRFRYKAGFDFSLWKSNQQQQSLKLIASNEILLNAGSSIIYNLFDQNRFYLGCNFQFNKHMGIELGYINVFQQKSTGYQFYDRNNIRFTIFHKITL